tara:strand:- start:6356 stop:6598 length:243 start_codon:yes stop_codon:yes gene_type:complete
MSIRKKIMGSNYAKLNDVVAVMREEDPFSSGTIVDFVEDEQDDKQINAVVYSIFDDVMFEAPVDECTIITRRFDCELGYH